MRLNLQEVLILCSKQNQCPNHLFLKDSPFDPIHVFTQSSEVTVALYFQCYTYRYRWHLYLICFKHLQSSICVFSITFHRWLNDLLHIKLTTIAQLKVERKTKLYRYEMLYANHIRPKTLHSNVRD